MRLKTMVFGIQKIFSVIETIFFVIETVVFATEMSSPSRRKLSAKRRQPV
jgi:hypothetical protein